MDIKETNGGVLVTSDCFDLADTLDCGQCFRFESEDNLTFKGFYKSHFLNATKLSDTETLFHNTDIKTFNEVWRQFFDFDTDYDAFKEVFKKDETLSKACDFAGGIRILKQEPWETLCSFIISQNNNIPRIKGIISRLCENFGEKCENGYLFPSAERIAKLNVEDLAPLRSGFRAKYILDAAKKVANKELVLDTLYTMPIDEARKTLMSIKGVGPKVAECTLLFGFYRLEAFPVDTWIKKVLTEYYPDGFPGYAREHGGVAQQYLFHYIRNKK